MATPAARIEDLTFSEADFRPLADGASKNPEYNDARLATKRKLADMAKDAVARLKASGLELEQRTSLHNPHQFNGKRVGRLWAYLVRPKKEKARLKKTLGADLAKDLDQAYKNAYLCLAIEPDALEVSLRIHVDAWYDGQNMKRRYDGGGEAELLATLNALPGFRLRLDNWKGEWICGQLTRESLAEFFKFYTPGEHSLAVDFRWPAPEGNREFALAAGVPGEMIRALQGLEGLYRWAAWSKESEFLFG
ncbi:MAG: hypothetical protein P8N31_09755 [Planctomycetota bacterium]|nr:hypothetical protein [Planctomycetota bacterium]MDG2143828.1 hypothetical protein [Planctomycetota bacterium]